ncbi:unnamed protein product [Medioppia subpectinata]|uniref:Uncharacterized protein n=1 Tax=Medioppia subpectinata TaxID=1979941 RepID=A0A7R9PYB5_9ACAR|nr:unnamed protein product [Medioppia subpectinata]CAG2104906.1 unnamed protein product [Medioppia subpectinata]
MHMTSGKNLNGQVVVVTGANTGIGKETAYQLTLRDAKVYILCRDQKKGKAAVKDIQSLNPKANIKLLSLDLSSLTSVRKCVEELSGLETKVDILINNAGVMACPEWQTEDGFEMQFGTNHLGHFLFTLHLIPLLKKAPAGRIVNVSSTGHQFGEINLQNINLRNGAYHNFFAYGQSKLANVLFSRELAKRLRHSNINTYSLNPGAIDTDLQRHVDPSAATATDKSWFRRNFFMTPLMGSQTTLYCALDDELADQTGYYYDNCRRVDHIIPEANDDKTAKSLWELSCDLVVVITGANTGIGKTTAHQLTLRDATVYIGCRDQKKGEAAVKDILALNPKANIKLLSLDLSSLKSVRKCVEELSGLETKVDILINNAGLGGCPESQTEDGFEMQIGTNHLGHFLFTLHLIPLLKKAPAARIVNVSSEGHNFGKIHLDNINLRNGEYNNILAYGQSKLANVLFSRELAKRLRHSNINTYCVHPGSIHTEFNRHMDKSTSKEGVRAAIMGWFNHNLLTTPLMGSQTTLYCALDDDIADETGYYYNNKKLNGQVVVVTGGNTGIGKETAYQLTLRDAKVYIGCRDRKKGEAAVENILALNPKANIKLLSLDLSSLKSVRKCVEELSGLETKVDILINNAGVAGCPEWQTEDGFEMQFGTNHLGHFLFTLHLIPLLKKAPAGRIVTVAAGGHNSGQIHLDNINLRNGVYHPIFAYTQSKLANVLFSRELAKRLRHSNINTYSLNPGAIATDLQRHMGEADTQEGVGAAIKRWFKHNFLMTPLMGSQTTLYCALDDELADQTGYYYEYTLGVGTRGKANIKLLSLDLSSLTSVRKCVEELSGLETKVDILINNAGVGWTPEWQTEDGFEMQFGTNHLGHFLFTLHLIPLLKKAPAGRIVTVSSAAHIIGKIHLDNINLRNGIYNKAFSYGQSKLANVLFSRELAKRLRHSNINTYSLHPGAIDTDFVRHIENPNTQEGVGAAIKRWYKRNLLMTPLMGSQTTLYCALDDELADQTGYYYDNCRRVDHMIPEANDDKTAKSLWELSCDLGNVKHSLKGWRRAELCDGVWIEAPDVWIERHIKHQPVPSHARTISSICRSGDGVRKDCKPNARFSSSVMRDMRSGVSGYVATSDPFLANNRLMTCISRGLSSKKCKALLLTISDTLDSNAFNTGLISSHVLLMS